MGDLSCKYTLQPLDPETEAFRILMGESQHEGFGMLPRLLDNWTTGRNRFSQPGEMLMAAHRGTELAGVCGLSIDPYAPDRRMGRVRHLYVRPTERRRGAGRLLVEAVIDRASRHFPVLNTRAAPGAFAFYEALGFRRVEGDGAVTHRLVFPPHGEGAG